MKALRALTLTAVALTILLCAFANLVNVPHKAGDDAANRSSGDVLVAALEAHNAAEGTYPATLANLVPSHIAAVPPTAPLDGAFRYELLDPPTAFTLAYDESAAGCLPSDAYWRWDSRTGSWEYVVW